MSTSIAAIGERDFAASLVDDAPAKAGQSNDAPIAERTSATGGEQLLRRLFPSWTDGQAVIKDKPQSSPRFDEQDLYAGGQPRATDIQQDKIGDCYFVATLAAVAEKQPDRIQDAIKFDPATGNYTVTLHK